MKSNGLICRRDAVSLLSRVAVSLAMVFQYAVPFVHSASGIPHLINFQGRLTNTSNQPRNGSFTFKFSIHDAVSGGNKLWPTTTENHTVTVINGIFSVSLGGGGEAIPATVFGQDQAYVEVVVNDGGGDETLSPRQRLLAVPYAMNAERFDGYGSSYYVSTAAVTQTILGDKTFSGTLTVPTPTLGGHAVTKDYVDTQTGGGTVVNLSASTQTKTGGFNVAGSIGAGTSTPSTQMHVFRGSGARGPQMLVSTGTHKLFEVNGASIVAGVPLGFYDGTVQYTAYPGASGFVDTTASTQTKTGGLIAYGKIGVGTPSPSGQMEIRATGTSFPDSWNDNLKLTGIFPALWLKDTSTDDGFYLGADNGALRFGYENAGTHQGYFMAIRSNGSVGIGTAVPGSKMHVFSGAGSVGPQMIVSTGTVNLFEVNGASIVANVPIFSTGGGSYVDTSDSIQTKSGGLNVTGKIGSGTSIPTSAIDVFSGSVTIRGTNSGLFVAGNGAAFAKIGDAGCGANLVGITLNGGADDCSSYNLESGPSDPNLYINRPSSFKIAFRENNLDQMTLLTGGNLGIGTDVPDTRLHVHGAAASSGPQMVVSTGTSRLFEVNGSSIVVRVPVYGASWAGGTITVPFGGTGATSLTGILKGNGASAFTAVTAPSGALVGDTDSQSLTNKTIGSTGLTFSGATTDMTTVSNEHLTIVPNGTGRVGIGTTVPDTPLQIFEAAATLGPLMVVSTGTSRLFEVNGASVLVNVPLRFPDGSLQTTAYTGAGFITASSADTLTNKTIGSTGLVFSGATSDVTTVSNEHLAIMPNGTGRVGIGTTAPSSLFDIFNGSITVRGSNLGLQVGTNFVVQSGGNVGIGTVNPAATLYVVGTSSVTGKFVSLDTTNQVYAVYAP